MKKYKNKIIGLIITLVIAIFLTFDTYAEETDQPSTEQPAKECGNGEIQNIEERYNLTLEQVGYMQYKISMKGDPKDLDDAAFKVIGTTTYDDYGDYVGSLTQSVDLIPEITKNQEAFFNAQPMTTDDGTILAVQVMLVRGTSKTSDCDYYGTLIVKDYGSSVHTPITGGATTKPNTQSIHHAGSICYNFYNGIWNESQFVGIKKSDFDEYNYKNATGYVINGKTAQNIYDSTLSYCSAEYINVGIEYTDSELANMIGNSITYIKSQTKSVGGGDKTFAELFNEIKNNAISSGNDKSGKTPAAGLACDWKLTSKSGDILDYYKNKKYFYKEEIVDSIDVQYEYNYAPGDTQTSASQTVCTRTCSEAVKVEYGPPVASKAGLCFEYKVKVTSYVECKADVELEPPTMSSSACNPSPFCHEKNWAWISHQAGPTEEFDACILDCDGGKYTSKCSVACYKKVYKNSKIKLAVDYTTSPKQMSLDLDTCIETSPDGGCYYWSGNQIMWKSTYQTGDWTNDVKALGRWYRATGYKTSDVGEGKKYDVSSNGIKTRKKSTSSTGHCQDICYWETDVCTKGKYLNPQSILEDYQENLKRYQSAVTQCKAAATCTNTTAEFEISVKYDSVEQDGSVKTNKVTFPYSTGKDSISSKGSGSANLNTATSLSDTTILSYDGCYNATEEKNWYMTEWSFPGTYIHNKTGEISFKVPSDPSGWYYENRKFCMPLDAKSTHTKWWEWYTIANTDFTNFCYTATDIENELASQGYNITAKATNFGYYGWNFTVDCFYALRNEECDIDETKNCCGTPVDKKTNINYTFRSIDRKNLFPNAPIEGVVDDTKRAIGFNWTSKARISELKNASYSVDPEKLVEDIQSKADTLYNDDTNLDYQFYLTPSTLNKIREYNKRNDYGTWNGKTEKNNGIYVYLSNLWNAADTDVETTLDLRGISGAILKTGTPGVNNED